MRRADISDQQLDQLRERALDLGVDNVRVVTYATSEAHIRLGLERFETIAVDGIALPDVLLSDEQRAVRNAAKPDQRWMSPTVQLAHRLVHEHEEALEGLAMRMALDEADAKCPDGPPARELMWLAAEGKLSLG